MSLPPQTICACHIPQPVAALHEDIPGGAPCPGAVLLCANSRRTGRHAIIGLAGLPIRVDVPHTIWHGLAALALAARALTLPTRAHRTWRRDMRRLALDRLHISITGWHPDHVPTYLSRARDAMRAATADPDWMPLAYAAEHVTLQEATDNPTLWLAHCAVAHLGVDLATLAPPQPTPLAQIDAEDARWRSEHPEEAAAQDAENLTEARRVHGPRLPWWWR